MADDLHATMLEVVTEKTGYPTEMLEPQMSLANDLGIDSIKRVEILGELRSWLQGHGLGDLEAFNFEGVRAGAGGGEDHLLRVVAPVVPARRPPGPRRASRHRTAAGEAARAPDPPAPEPSARRSRPIAPAMRWPSS